MKNYFHRLLIKLTAWISPYIGKIHAPWAHKKVKSKDYRDFTMKFLDEGTILISKTNGEVTNLFIPAFWSHAAIYTGAGTVIESIGEGVVETDLIDYMMTKDFIVAVKPKMATVPQMSKAVDFARSQLGKPYDYSFQKDVKAFYCSELVQWSYNQANEYIPFDMKEVLGVITITPDDIAEGKEFVKVWESESCKEIKR